MPSCPELFRRIAIPQVFHAWKSLLFPNPFLCHQEDFLSVFLPRTSLSCFTYFCSLAFPCSQGCFSCMERGERHLASWGAGWSLPPQQWGVSGMHQQGWGFPSPTTSAHLLLLQARFVAPVLWAMPAIAAYFVVRPYTFLSLFASTVRKTWGLAQTLHLPFAATTPRWISPLVD